MPRVGWGGAIHLARISLTAFVAALEDASAPREGWFLVDERARLIQPAQYYLPDVGPGTDTKSFPACFGRAGHEVQARRVRVRLELKSDCRLGATLQFLTRRRRDHCESLPSLLRIRLLLVAAAQGSCERQGQAPWQHRQNPDRKPVQARDR
jgi:hypothetical protein